MRGTRFAGGAPRSGQVLRRAELRSRRSPNAAAAHQSESVLAGLRQRFRLSVEADRSLAHESRALARPSVSAGFAMQSGIRADSFALHTRWTPPVRRSAIRAAPHYRVAEGF